MYAAAKHGVVGLVRSLGPQLAQTRIQINGLAPCIVGTLSSCTDPPVVIY